MFGVGLIRLVQQVIKPGSLFASLHAFYSNTLVPETKEHSVKSQHIKNKIILSKKNS